MPANTAIVLARRPGGRLSVDDFRKVDLPVPVIGAGEMLVEHKVFSMDAGFRNWMNEGSGDGYLAAMPLGEPVMSLTLGTVVESRRPDFVAGDLFMGRLAWTHFSKAGPDDFVTRLPRDPRFPLSYYAGILGGTGMTAWFGVNDIARPRGGDIAVVSAAAGAVGIVAGQLLKAAGGYVIGISGNAHKCERLVREFGFDAAINHRDENLDEALARLCPDGMDIFFDNVGGRTLNTALHHLREFARVVLCGSVSTYESADGLPVPGPDNLFEMVTKRVLLKGFMYTDEAGRYPEALAALEAGLANGSLRNAEYVLKGIESAPQAFCDMLAGKNLGKTLVAL
jgi:NADPH-dependent curcumin reductase CurA